MVSAHGTRKLRLRSWIFVPMSGGPSARRSRWLRARIAISGGLLVALVMAASGIAVGASAVPLCQASQLSARVVGWQGAAGSRIADVELVNTSFIHCSLRDLPQVQLVSSHGLVLISGVRASTTGHTHGLVPLAYLKTEVSASSYCGPAFSAPVTLAFILPRTLGRIIAIPASPPDTAGVPPCNGAPGSTGDISMHTWHF